MARITIKGQMPAVLRAMNMLTESDLELGNRTTFNSGAGSAVLKVDGNPREVVKLLEDLDLQIGAE